MNYVTIVLRLLHIFGGVYWAGAAWFMAFFVEPTMRAAGPGAQPFMQKLMEGGRLSMSISIAAIVTVLAGGFLYFMIWFRGPDSLTSPMVLGFTIGAVIGLVALGVGGGVTGPTSVKMGKLGAEIAAGGKPPTPEQMEQMKALQTRLAMAGRWTAWLTAAALFFMATARYF
jgi:uncharacterized membrane protein